MTTDWLVLTDGPLSRDTRTELLALVWNAQRRAAAANTSNASNVATMIAAAGSGSALNAIVSAMLSTGGVHAPVAQAREVLFRRPVPAELPAGKLVPGFGNSFHKDQIDPEWKAAACRLRDFPAVWEPICAWSALLESAGKPKHPNAAALTAAVAELVRWPDGLEVILVAQPRFVVWAEVYLNSAPTKKLLS